MKDVDGKTALHTVAAIIDSRIREADRVIANGGAPDKLPGRRKEIAKMRLHLQLLDQRIYDSSHPDRPELGTVPMDQLGAICAMASGVTGLWKELRAVAVPTVLDIMDIFEERP